MPSSYNDPNMRLQNNYLRTNNVSVKAVCKIHQEQVHIRLSGNIGQIQDKLLSTQFPYEIQASINQGRFAVDPRVLCIS